MSGQNLASQLATLSFGTLKFTFSKSEIQHFLKPAFLYELLPRTLFLKLTWNWMYLFSLSISTTRVSSSAPLLVAKMSMSGLSLLKFWVAFGAVLSDLISKLGRNLPSMLMLLLRELSIGLIFLWVVRSSSSWFESYMIKMRPQAKAQLKKITEQTPP